MYLHLKFKNQFISFVKMLLQILRHSPKVAAGKNEQVSQYYVCIDYSRAHYSMKLLFRAHHCYCVPVHLCGTVSSFVRLMVVEAQRFQHCLMVTYIQLIDCSSVEIPLNQPHFLRYLSAFSRALTTLGAIVRIVVDDVIDVVDCMAIQIGEVRIILYFLDVNLIHANDVQAVAKILDVLRKKKQKKMILILTMILNIVLTMIAAVVRLLVDICY